MRILLVDDHPLVREGLSARIEAQSDLEVCGETGSIQAAMVEFAEKVPDLTIVDIQLEDGNGIDLIKDIHTRYPYAKMLVVSAFDETLYAERALRAGALGYISKRELQEKVLEAIRTVLSGKRYLSGKMTQHLLNQAVNQKGQPASHPVERLSNRELEVFQMIGNGMTTAAIAGQLHLSVHTIDTHREKLRHKLGAKNGAELMKLAVQWVLENG
ncbi:DNA-binding response regulator [Bremerella cremea]|uniref:DNA-binding response regulator n=2 Tax=Bremerella cremea TaxID=1031537 RepID=A0A368KWY8_9BACT|nr:DNA-binding response regulator [Bremerella cremea]